jgi:hypothetical protein
MTRQQQHTSHYLQLVLFVQQVLLEDMRLLQ